MKTATPAEIRSNLREALRDELATIRCINGALLAPTLPAEEQHKLIQTRADALTVVRRLLLQLHPPARPTARRKASK